MKVLAPTFHASWLIALAACTGTTPTPACDHGDDVDAFVCGRDLTLEIGTGEDAFVAVEDGGVVDLVKGPQGLQHVFLSLSASLDPQAVVIERAMVRLVVWRDDDHAELVPEDSFGVGFVLDGTEATVPGMRWVVQTPEEVVGNTVVIGLAFAPVGYDAEARGILRAQVQWAPDATP